LALENLEERLNPAPTLFSDMYLPGAGAVWNDPRVSLSASPIFFADPSGRPQDDLLTVSADMQLYAYTFTSAGQVSILQHYVLPPGAGFLQSTPAVANLPSLVATNNPNGEAIFIGTSTGQVFGFNAATGAILAGWPESVAFQQPGYPAFPNDVILGHIAVGDLDGDGVPEIVVTSLNQMVTAFHADGSVMWRYSNDDTIFGGVAIGDLNRDGSMEVVFGGDSGSASGFYANGGHIVCLSASGRREWVKDIDQTVWSTPTLADLTGSGKLDVIVGTGSFYLPQNGFPNLPASTGNKVYALDSQGHDLFGWPYITDANSTHEAQVNCAPAVADLNDDGYLDVVVADNEGRLHAISGKPGDIDPNTGVQRALWVTQAFPTADGQVYSSPVIADINGDGKPDVIIGDGGGFLRGFDGTTGAQIFNFTVNPSTGFGLQIQNAAAVGHFKPGTNTNGAPHFELAVVGNRTEPANHVVESPGHMLMFDLDASTLAPPWAMLRQNSNNDAVVRPDSLPSGISDMTLITSIYNGALGRGPTSGELAGGLQAARHAPSLRPVIAGIITSPAARDVQITTWYLTYLGRAPEPGVLGPNGIYQQEMSAGATYLQLQDGIVATDEAFGHAGGTNALWVKFLYRTILGRSPGPGEDAGWLNFVTITGNRPLVALAFLQTPESLFRMVAHWYLQYGLAVNPPIDSQIGILLDLYRGRTEEQCITDMVNGLGDYLASQREGSWLRAIYMQLLQRPIGPVETVSWLADFINGVSFNTIVTTILESPEYQSNLVNSWFTRYLHRPASPTELNATVVALEQGTSRSSIIAAIFSGDEFFTTQAHGNLTTFINLTFTELGNGAPDATTLNFWLNPPASLGSTRTALPQMILGLGQFQPSGVTGNYYRQLVDEWFYTYLGRHGATPSYQGAILGPTPTFTGQALVDALMAGANQESIQASILTSPEYLQLAREKAFWLGDRWRM
jgi:outer membrane protein assembly factor BamB